MHALHTREMHSISSSRLPIREQAHTHTRLLTFREQWKKNFMREQTFRFRNCITWIALADPKWISPLACTVYTTKSGGKDEEEIVTTNYRRKKVFTNIKSEQKKAKMLRESRAFIQAK